MNPRAPLFAQQTLPLCALALLSNACFFGYDSNWGAAKRAQKNGAALAAPAALESTPPPPAGSASADDARPGAVRTYRVRVYATPAYAARTLDWHRTVNDLLDDANRVLAPSLGARLTVESFHDWSTDEQSLTAALNALGQEDEARDVDWVVGFVGSLPRATRSFHELGMANVPGKHLVLRATSAAEEKDAIDRAFDRLGADEREKLGKARGRHRAAAVFLHEIGHTLGAPHARDPQSLMHAEYDTHMEAYGDGPASLMRAGLAHRDDKDAGDTARALLAVLDGVPADTWVPADRASLDARLRAALGPSPSTSPSPVASAEAPAPAASPALPADVAALSREAQATFLDASRALAAGDADAADARAHALVSAHRDVLSVQDLRCRIAVAKGSDWNVTRAECARLMELSTGKK